MVNESAVPARANALAGTAIGGRVGHPCDEQHIQSVPEYTAQLDRMSLSMPRYFFAGLFLFVSNDAAWVLRGRGGHIF